MFRRFTDIGGRIIPLVSAVAFSSVPAVLVSGCSNSNGNSTTLTPAVEVGQLRLDLSAVSTTGRVYRLRQGTFSIVGRAGGVSTTVSTESSPNDASLLVELAPDTYDVFLEPGYQIELVEDFGLAFRIRNGTATAGRIRPVARDHETGSDAGVPAPPPFDPPLPGTGGGAAGSGMEANSPSAGIGVPSQLLSSNPAVVTITEDAISPLNFIFRVQNEVLQTGSGILRLGIEVLDENFTPPASCTDEFEPNDSFETAAVIPSDEPIEATLCDRDSDFFSFQPSVAEGQGFTVSIAFDEFDGVLDASLLDSEGFFTGFGSSIESGIELVGIATGGPFVVATNAFLFSSVQLAYTLEVGEGATPGENLCCESSPFPGCAGESVEQCICELDSFCCEVAFDEQCVQLSTECGSTCTLDAATSDCCTATDEPGCTDPEVLSCICEVDSTCCTESFDEACVTQAIAECGSQCAVAEAESDCCSAANAPGCTIPSVESCVCELDAFCCLGSFDETCATLAASQCDVQCGG